MMREGVKICLRLKNNQIEDIAPLVENEGLSKGDGIDLRGNPLRNKSIDTYIPKLEERGANVLLAEIIPGDCNGDGTVTIDEVQKSINCFLGIQNGCCNRCDLDGNGSVTIDEVQKVINAFLGEY